MIVPIFYQLSPQTQWRYAFKYIFAEKKFVPTEDRGCTPVCSKIFESNETMPNENKHNDIKQNRQYVERKLYRSDTLKNTNI